MLLSATVTRDDKLLCWLPLKVSTFCYLSRDTEELPTKPLLLLANWSMLNGPFGLCQTRKPVEYLCVFCLLIEIYSSFKRSRLWGMNISIRMSEVGVTLWITTSRTECPVKVQHVSVMPFYLWLYYVLVAKHLIRQNKGGVSWLMTFPRGARAAVASSLRGRRGEVLENQTIWVSPSVGSETAAETPRVLSQTE